MRPQIAFFLFGALVVVAIAVTFATMARASKGYDRARRRRAEAGPGVPCSTCRSSMQLVGVVEFKVNDTPDATDLQAAASLGSSRGALPLEVHRCPTCRRLDLYLPPAAG
ncbi:MAG TPA: hypothetical protein VHJ40_09430 [Actinomycetota bacterium]|nr:hypothetical protein [Actinomycetota bacterium]